MGLVGGLDSLELERVRGLGRRGRLAMLFARATRVTG
jgi:hypothetical protein